MDFSNLEDIKNYLSQVKRTLPDKEFHSIDFDRFRIHCLDNYNPPYHNFENLLHYETVTVFVFEDLHGKEGSVKPSTDPRFQNFAWTKYFNYIDSHAHLKDSYMGRHIPLPEVMQLIRDIYKVSRLKMFY